MSSEVNKSLIVPLAIWPKLPPKHNITCLLHISSLNRLITASDVGHLMSWKLNKGNDKIKFEPEFYFIGHRSKVKQLVPICGNSLVNMKYVVSFAEEHEIAVWEITTGRNVEFLSNTPWQITFVHSQSVKNYKQELLFCCQRSPEIIVLNSISLTVICHLICSSSPNWFSAVLGLPNTQLTETVVLATTLSGVICMWVTDLKKSDGSEKDDKNSSTSSNNSTLSSNGVASNVKQQDTHRHNSIAWIHVPSPYDPPFIEADQCVNLDQIEPIKIKVNPDCNAVILVMTSYRLKIFHAVNWDLLCHIDCHKKDYFVEVDFINFSTVMVHCQSGTCLIYKLPDRACSQNDQFLNQTTSMLDSIPSLSYAIPAPYLNKLLLSVSITKISDSQFDILQYYKNDFFNSINLNITEDDFRVESKCGELYNQWMEIDDRSSNLPEFLGEGKSIVTSLLIMPDLSLVAVGMETGSIYVTQIDSMLQGIFIDSPNSTPPVSIHLQGHEGPVLALLHPASVLKLPHKIASLSPGCPANPCLQLLQVTTLFWSAGSDCTVRLWDIKSHSDSLENPQLLKTFYCHSAPIIALKLHHLPPSRGTSLEDQFCGFSQGFVAAMFKLSENDSENCRDIRQMINMCMNAFIVSISEDDTICIISMMKRKIIINTSCHESGPVRNLGWQLHSGYLLVESITGRVFVWDLAAGLLDRVEMENGTNLLENCNVVTRIRSRHTQHAVSGSTFMRRHSLGYVIQPQGSSSTTMSSASNNSSPSHSHHSNSSKFLRVQFIRTKHNNYRFVPVLCFDIDLILESLDVSRQNIVSFYSSFRDADQIFDVQNTNNKLEKSILESNWSQNFDTFVNNISTNRHMVQLKSFLLKILLAVLEIGQSESTSALSNQITEFNLKQFNWSIGAVNMKTGCIIFDLRPLFKNESDSRNVSNNLIRLILSNKLQHLTNSEASTSQRKKRRESCQQDESDNKPRSILHRQRDRKKELTNRNQLFDKYKQQVISEWSIVNLERDNQENLGFYRMELGFSKILTLALNENKIIITNSLEILDNFISQLSMQEIQMYILLWRMFLYPALDNNTNQSISPLQVLLDTVAKQPNHVISTLQASYATDWMWWWVFELEQQLPLATTMAGSLVKVHNSQQTQTSQSTSKHISTDTLLRLRVAGLTHMAAIGSYLHDDDECSCLENRPESQRHLHGNHHHHNDPLSHLHDNTTDSSSHHHSNLNCDSSSNNPNESSRHLHSSTNGTSTTTNQNHPKSTNNHKHHHNSSQCCHANRKLFSKMFSLDNFFLAKLTSEFLCGIIQRLDLNKPTFKSLANLVRFSIQCIGRGFTVWEPYMDNSSLLLTLLSFSSLPSNTLGVLETVADSARESLVLISNKRPLVLVMSCYREMLRVCNHSSNDHSSSGNGAGIYVSGTDHQNMASKLNSFTRRFSSPVLSSLDQSSPPINPHSHKHAIQLPSPFESRGIIPILRHILQQHITTIEPVLSEIIELLLYVLSRTHSQYDLNTELHEFFKYPAVSVNTASGHVCVGSTNGNVVLIDSKMGKYFTCGAHKKSIKLTKFSEDGKYVASYSEIENIVKIWHINPSSSIFHLGGSSNHHGNANYGNTNTHYSVKLVNTIAVPHIHQMVSAAMLLASSGRSEQPILTSYHESDKDRVKMDFIGSSSNDRSLNFTLGQLTIRKIKY